MSINLHTKTCFALGGEVSLNFVSDQTNAFADQIFSQILEIIYVFEKKFSRFLPDSELTVVNNNAGSTTKISQELTNLLMMAQKFSKITDNLFNPFVLPAIQRTGYTSTSDPDYSDDHSPNYALRSVYSPDKLKLDPKTSTILIPKNSAIDLGGIGKGYLADQIGDFLRTKNVVGYWLNFSGDIATYGTQINGSSISMNIQDADAPDKSLPEIIICPNSQYGVATSGTLKRQSHGKKLLDHHIIDPRTGLSASTDVILATVGAKSCTQADILASCAVILGSKLAPKWLEDHGADQYFIQSRSNNLDVIISKKLKELVK